jgi:NADH-quinone oxidoreductase subunit K
MSPIDLFDIDVLKSYLLIGAALFALGMLGFLTRRNVIVMFLSVEMMLQGTALSLVAFGRYHGVWTGQVFTIVILTVAACEASIAMALIVVLFNQRSSLDVTLWQEIREASVQAEPSQGVVQEAELIEAMPGPETYPHLAPAGVEPEHPVRPWIERRR